MPNLPKALPVFKFSAVFFFVDICEILHSDMISSSHIYKAFRCFGVIMEKSIVKKVGLEEPKKQKTIKLLLLFFIDDSDQKIKDKELIKIHSMWYV